ncbi:MAG: hypothetical protein U1E17_12915 [Geminicoccaceae bacterium]
MRLLMGLVIVAAIAFFGYRMLQTEQGQQTMQQAADQASRAAQQATAAANQATAAAREAVKAAAETAQATAAKVAGGVDVGAQLKDLVARTSATLSGISDQASADAALPSLQDARTKLDGMSAQVEQLPAEGRKLLAGAIGTALPSLRELVAKAETMPGGATIKPTLDAMLGRLESWAKAPA